MKRATTSRSDRKRKRRRRLCLQKMEDRRLLAADLPYGVTPIENGEVLLGTVTVTPVFFESDGSIDADTEQWTPAEIETTLQKIQDSVDWWSDMLATQTSVHTLDFHLDDSYSRQSQVSTGYEPIARDSTVFQRYVGDWLTDMGYGDAPSIERAVAAFNDSQRRLHGTDWAFTIFVADSSNDADGFFASGGFSGAFAYPGGLFIVIPSGRPVSTYTHEMGHIFWGRDEYPGAGSWTDYRGYYNTQNWNASDNPTPGFVQQVSIMRGGVVAANAFDNMLSPPSTLAMVGWQDSDGDGIFDIADVPLKLDAIGSYDINTGIYSFRGSAQVDTLANENPAGFQSDITFNRVHELQYRLDDGDWQTALAPDATQVDFDLEIAIPPGFSQIQWRAIDTQLGVSSAVLTGDSLTPVFSGVGGGFAFVDNNLSNGRDADEELLAGTQFTLRHADGSGLFHHAFDADTLPDDVIAPPAGMRFKGEGMDLDGRVATLPALSSNEVGKVFQAFNSRYSFWNDQWGADQQLEITSDQTSGRVTIDFVATSLGGYGVEAGSYARAEAYDAAGNRIDRVTSDFVLAGEQARLTLDDSNGRIARVVVYGHAETIILITAIEFGRSSNTAINPDGTFSVDGLPNGDYLVEAVAPNLIYQFDSQATAFQIAAGAVSSIALAADRVDSPRHNSELPGDVNGDQTVSARDALAIINDLGRLGNRTLTADETSGMNVDVNNDGKVSAIDALRVINILARAQSGEGEQSVSNTPQPRQAPKSTSVTETTQTAVLPSPLAAASVDGVFSRDLAVIAADPPNWSNLNIPELLNSAGKQSSDESPIDRRPDRFLGSDPQEAGENRAQAAEERQSLGLMHENGNIGDSFAKDSLSEELF